MDEAAIYLNQNVCEKKIVISIHSKKILLRMLLHIRSQSWYNLLYFITSAKFCTLVQLFWSVGLIGSVSIQEQS